MKSDLHDFEMQLHHETAKAVLVSDDGVREHAIWLPKASIEFEQKGKGIVTVTMPEWFAVEKGLL